MKPKREIPKPNPPGKPTASATGQPAAKPAEASARKIPEAHPDEPVRDPAQAPHSVPGTGPSLNDLLRPLSDTASLAAGAFAKMREQIEELIKAIEGSRELNIPQTSPSRANPAPSPGKPDQAGPPDRGNRELEGSNTEPGVRPGDSPPADGQDQLILVAQGFAGPTRSLGSAEQAIKGLHDSLTAQASLIGRIFALVETSLSYDQNQATRLAQLEQRLEQLASRLNANRPTSP